MGVILKKLVSNVVRILAFITEEEERKRKKKGGNKNYDTVVCHWYN